MSYLSKKSNTFKGDIVKKLKPLGGVMSVKTNQTHGYFNHISVSLDLISDYELTGDQAILLHKIYMLSQQEPCFASNKFLGQGWGKSANAISKLIARLAEKELIAVEIEYEENSKQVKKRIIHINMGCEDDTLSSDKQGVMPDCHGGSCQVGEDNILDKNIITNKEKSINNINTKKEARYEKFIGEVDASGLFHGLPDHRDEFIDYWTEGNPKMRFEKEKTWELSRRIKRWLRNSKDFRKTKANADRNQEIRCMDVVRFLEMKLLSGEFNRKDCGEYVRRKGISLDDELYIKRKLIELGCFKEDA